MADDGAAVTAGGDGWGDDDGWEEDVPVKPVAAKKKPAKLGVVRKTSGKGD